ncbi:hypothetical protein O6H91_09G106400 [Diphasiastrum complanatum]|uniref:Uncharacterized protein n=1 Tax=Diphasiastrum complanatum TaxID=34168 RepID=A0ACC2CSW5_DIPCM|nr:hypothetical protein O6H91_09G106400 [Diphasiastrum complanatum]
MDSSTVANEAAKDSLRTPLLPDLLSHSQRPEYSIPSSKAADQAEYSPSNHVGKLNLKNTKSSAASNGSESHLVAQLMRVYTGDGSVDSKGRPSVRAETGGWRTCPFILGTECCERLAFYGINANLVNYLTRVLLQGNAAAAKQVAIWCGTGYMTPLLGAFIADAYLGRYRTITTFSVVYLVGLISLTVSASVPSLNPPPCLEEVYACQQASPAQLSFFYLSLYLIALGMGGIKSCVSSFGADQFDDEDRSERKKKTHFFNWFYLSINAGSLIATSILVYIQDNASWGLGYGIPAMFMAIAISTFILGTPIYRYQKPGGSPFTRITQVFVAAARKRSIKLPSDERALYGFDDKESVIQGTRMIQHTKQFK